MPTEKYAHAPGDPRALPAHREAVRPLRQRAVPHRGDGPRVGRRPLAVDHPHQPRRRVHRPVPRHGHRPAARAEAAGHPRHRGLRGPLVPHQPLGLRLHRRRPRGRADGQAGRQARRHHRHRRHVGAGVPHLATACGTLYVFQRTPSSVDVRDNRPTDPEWFADDQHARLAAALAGELHRQPDRRHGRGGPGDGRLDRPRPPRPQPDHGAAAGGVHPRGDDGGLRGLRLREDGGDPRAGSTRSSRTRRPRRT